MLKNGRWEGKKTNEHSILFVMAKKRIITVVPKPSFKERFITGAVATLFGLLFVGVASLAFFVVQARLLEGERVSLSIPTDTPEEATFPVGVDPKHELIVENPDVDVFFEEHILANGRAARHVSWIGKIVGRLALMDWYQNLASASTRLLVIVPGERKEEIAAHFGKILGWSKEEREVFLANIIEASPQLEEGKFFPGRYTVSKEVSPEEVAELIQTRFREEILSRYSTTTESQVPLADALTLASLLEREAYDFTDMRIISGIIWNRIFADMNLQIDATLQYAKGKRSDQPWWPKVTPRDKYIDSSYNTYEHPGLPPTPIANPSVESILAALNPKKTDCLYYFHDRNAGFHCSPTYEGHVALLKEYYGRGK